MTPYASFSYFGFLLYAALPAVVAGALGRLNRWFVTAASLLMLALQYGALLTLEPSVSVRQFWVLLGYVIYQGLLVKGFLRVKAMAAGRFKWAVSVAVCLSLLPLAIVKIWPMYPGGVSALGFLGISYLTFRTLDVLFGIHDGTIKAVRLEEFWPFLLFFPTVASGPIDRYRRFLTDWQARRSREEFLQDLDVGIHRIFRGFLYKFIIAYLIKRYWMDQVATAPGVLPVVSYMYAYSLYLFFDFAGYSAFAVGVSRLFGIRTPENFDRPFLAQNIRDFWNRWHITLSWWFRDHVYMRFVMWATRRKLLKDKHLISYLGFTVSMGLMGVWHGLNAYYILYGFYHAGLIIGFDLLSRWNKEKHIWGTGPVWRALGIFFTVQSVCFGLLLFSGRLFQ